MTVYQDNNVKFTRNSRLKHIELRFSQYRQSAFGKHTHDTYSVGIIKEGQTEFFCRNRTGLIRRGEIALINPGEVHACNPKNGSVLTYYMLYIEPDLIRDILCALPGKKARDIEFATPIVAENLLCRGLTEVCLSMAGGRVDLGTETILYETLAEIIQKYGNAAPHNPVPKQGAGSTIETGRAYLMENLFRSVSLQELAAHSGLSPFHFLREFRKRYGLPPYAYQLQQRVNAAKRLLAKGKPIAHVAAEVGFADQSHFTRKFKSYVGATPRQYQLAIC